MFDIVRVACQAAGVSYATLVVAPARAVKPTNFLLFGMTSTISKSFRGQRLFPVILRVVVATSQICISGSQIFSILNGINCVVAGKNGSDDISPAVVGVGILSGKSAGGSIVLPA